MESSFFFFLLLFRAAPWHLGGSQARGGIGAAVGVESEWQLPAYTTVTATQDPNRICNLHHSSQQHWILNPLSEARDGTHILTDLGGGVNC